MIELSGINKYYKYNKKKNYHALKDIDLKIEDGEFVAIIGRSGAGKTTLLNIIGLLDNYDSGKYLIDGQNTQGMNDTKLSKLRNEKIGFVLQDYALIENKSVMINVMLPLFFNKKYNFSKMQQVSIKVLEKLGIDDQSKKKVNQLSGGQKQRVAIARAIVNNPSFILADEPTGALDTKTSAEIMDLFKALNAEGKTVIIITHDPNVAEACKRKIEISDGKLINLSG